MKNYFEEIDPIGEAGEIKFNCEECGVELEEDVKYCNDCQNYHDFLDLKKPILKEVRHLLELAATTENTYYFNKLKSIYNKLNKLCI